MKSGLSRLLALSALISHFIFSPTSRCQEKVERPRADLKLSTLSLYKSSLELPQNNTFSKLLVDHLDQIYRENRGQFIFLETDPEQQAKEFLNIARRAAKDYLRGTDGYFILRDFVEDKGEWLFDKIVPDKVENRIHELLHLDAKKPIGIDFYTRDEKIGEELFDPWQVRERLYRTTLGIGMHPSIIFRSGDLKLKVYYDKIRPEFEYDMPYNLSAKMGADIKYDQLDRLEPYLRISKLFKQGEIGIRVAKSNTRGADIGVYLVARY